MQHIPSCKAEHWDNLKDEEVNKVHENASMISCRKRSGLELFETRGSAVLRECGRKELINANSNVCHSVVELEKKLFRTNSRERCHS